MGRPTIPGIYRDARDGWCVDKTHKNGHRLRYSGGKDYAEAENWLLGRLAAINAAPVESRPRYTFDQAAAHYLELNAAKASIDLDVWLLGSVMPFIGALYLDQVYDAKLAKFKADRAKVWKSKTINLAIGAVRRVLNLAARSWRDDEGHTWLATAPLLSDVEGGDEREPRQLTWKQQRESLPALPPHLGRMALFDLNTGARDAVVCGLRWAWEIKVPELGISVFDVPRKTVKGKKRSRILVCNSVAQSIIESVRGQHEDYVFVYSQQLKKPKYRPIETMNNTAWQNWRRDCGLDLHVHDLRHTVGMRLREAGVHEETRADILWHVREGMPQHYAVAQIREIHAALELITDERHGWNRSLAGIAEDARVPVKVPVQKKTG